jgi:flagellar hook assembly protein FlgD
MSRSGYDVVDTIIAYTSRIAPSKVILGVPYYGRAWSTAGSTVHATNTSSFRTGPSTSVIYATAAGYLAQYGRKYEATEQVAWTAYRRQNCTSSGCVTSWRQLYVDDATAIRRKYDLVNAYGLRGAGIWALGYDGTRPELWNAIQAKFITDSTPPAVGIRALPPTAANPGFTVAWSGTDDVGITAYDVQASVDSGGWRAWLTGTKAASAVWFGVDGHAYAFRVRARDARGNWSAWNVASHVAATPAAIAVGGFGTVRVDGLAVRAAPDTSASRLGSLSANNLVAIVGGPRSADGSTWYQVLGPISSGPRSPPVPRLGGGPDRQPVRVRRPGPRTRSASRRDRRRVTGTGRSSLGVTAAAVGQRSFLPNGDRSKDAIRIDWTNARTLDRLVLRVYRANGTLVGEVPVRQLAAGHRTTTWNGIVGGRRVPNGRYLVTLVGRAGGTTLYNPAFGFQAASLALHGVTVDTVAPTVRSASITSGLLSLNGDGTLNRRSPSSPPGRLGWAFGVAPVSGSRVGTPVLIRSGGGGTANITWTGRTSAGAVVPDGTYRVQAVAADAAGNRVSRTWTVRVDRTPPAIVPVAPPAFSPNGDGVADTARLAWASAEPLTGTAAVYHGSRLVRSWRIAKAAASGAASWAGTDAAGRRVADGMYTFRVTGRDAAGNAPRTCAGRVDRIARRWAGRRRPSRTTATRWRRRPRMSFRLADGDGQRGGLLADDARPDDLDEPEPRGGRPHLDVERPDQRRRVRGAGHLHPPGHRPERDRDERADPRHPRRRLHRLPVRGERQGRPDADRHLDPDRGAVRGAGRDVQAAGSGRGPPDGHRARWRAVPGLLRRREGIGRDGNGDHQRPGLSGWHEHDLSAGRGAVTGLYTAPR